jgi:hypothetical protein
MKRPKNILKLKTGESLLNEHLAVKGLEKKLLVKL